jgi:hypothetical protein
MLAFVLDLLQQAHRPVEQQFAPFEQVRAQPGTRRTMQHESARGRQSDGFRHDIVEYASQPFGRAASHRSDVKRRRCLEGPEFRQQPLLDRARLGDARRLHQQPSLQIEVGMETRMEIAPAVYRIARETNLEACVATARNHVDECSAV